MREHLVRQRQTGGHQHGRPVHRVEAQNVLADQVDVGRPDRRELLVVLAVADGGDVVQQRVEPDVDDLLVVPRQGDAPPLERDIEMSSSPLLMKETTSL